MIKFFAKMDREEIFLVLARSVFMGLGESGIKKTNGRCITFHTCYILMAVSCFWGLRLLASTCSLDLYLGCSLQLPRYNPFINLGVK